LREAGIYGAGNKYKCGKNISHGGM
jgi:hypothetical protein